MKHLIILLSLLSTLLLLIPSEAASNPAVIDVDGSKLHPGMYYYILPAIHGRGGGLTFGSRNTTCPLYVREEFYEVNNAIPVTFTPADPNVQIVRLSTDVNVQFSALNYCLQSSVWKLGDVDGVSGRRYVIAGGMEGSPGVDTVSNWFKIEKYGEKEYKLVFCPSVCEFCKVVCGDVGVFVEDGQNLLGVGGTLFPVVFKRRK
ncbi:kunitz trypsin inhibitor 5-like [Typha angustifolia]|uniref:kunitz trypsin inhibitor 5-like n=1 Tax=Typha angustifolia TaxID=59011 RepID=UPI003C2DD17D